MSLKQLRTLFYEPAAPLTPKTPHDCVQYMCKIVCNMSHLLDVCQIGQAQKKIKSLNPSGK